MKYQERSLTFDVPEGVKTPWFKTAGDTPVTLQYFDGSMVDALEATALALPNVIAYNFYGNKVSYKDFVTQIHEAAKALKTYGVTVCPIHRRQLFYFMLLTVLVQSQI